MASDFTLLITIGRLVPALRLSLYRKCLLHRLASYSSFAADYPSEIHLALFELEVYGLSITALLVESQAKLA